MNHGRKIFYFSLLIIMSLVLACNPSKKIHKSGNSSTVPADAYKTYSKTFGVDFTGSEDKKLLDELSTWIGVPYVYGGESKTGTDCSGLVQTVFKTVYNISLYRTAFDLAKNCDSVNKKNLKSGDLVFFKINSTKISHVGIYLASNKFIHASSKGVMVSDLAEAYYTKYYYSAGRVKSLK
ncbi:MAG: NlpC/P60 family protein [Bacteroidota bacterium]